MNSKSNLNNEYQEYLWAMRQMLSSESNSEERLVKVSSFSNTEKLKGKNDNLLTSISEQHSTRILASFVPDEVIYDVNNYNPRVYDACLLFGDVSGFTNLCEQYTRTAIGGASKLTVVLNNFLGALIAEVLSHNGDIVKFSGDAFLSMFKSSSMESLRDAVHLAIDSAVSIQNTCGTYVTDTGLQLKVKLAISCGQVVFSLIGNEKYTHYICTGQPIFDVKKAEKKAKAGEIIVNYSAWGYIGANEYTFEPLNDDVHIRVLNYGINWRAVGEMERRMTAHYIRKMVYDTTKNKIVAFATEEEQEYVHDEPSVEDFAVRPCVNVAVKRNLKNDLRKFIFAPVIRGIDSDEPLEYLTEMRQVVTVFINVVVYKIEILHYVRIIDTTFKTVTGLVEEGNGSVNKISLFDKDLMIIALFGLRGFKDESECQNGLICAYKCQEEISKLDYVKICSVGVTTGMAYCGVVGHTLRREYTVIGLSVNKAARLMMAYPGKVVCDRETFLHSKMENRHFILQEQRNLKGISHAGPVYEFIKHPIPSPVSETLTSLPMLGRKTEIKLYKHLLETCLEIRKTELKCGNLYFNHHSVMIVKGKSRLGKTRLLDEIIRCTPANIPAHKISLSFKDNKLQFKTIQLIFTFAMGLEETSTKNEVKHKIVSYMKSYKVAQVLCCLNSIFKIDIAKSVYYVSLSKQEKDTLTRDAFSHLARTCFPKTYVIGIDDGQFIDDDSWLLLKLMLDLELLFLVINIGINRYCSQYFNTFVESRKVRVVELQQIDKWYHAGLACQFLNVQAIPPELEKLIQLRSEGNPGWIESFLLTLKQIHGIVIKHVDESIFAELGLVKPPSYMLGRKDLKESSSDSDEDNWRMYKQCYYENDHVENKQVISEGNVVLSNIMAICLVAPDYSLENDDLELSMDVMIMKTFDSLTSYEQLLLKMSSVIGNIFLRDMLLYIMGTASKERDTALAVKKLFEMRVLQCARGDFTEDSQGLVMNQRTPLSKPDSSIQCNCIGYTRNVGGLPKYAFCGYIRFTLPIFRETTYNLLTDSQKKEFHTKAMKYLEKETRRCISCGRGFFYNILGTRIESDLIAFRKNDHKKTTVYRTQLRRQRSKHSSLINSIESRNLQRLFNGSSESNDFLIESNFGVNLVKKLSKRFSLTRTFSFTDFSSCQCSLILDNMYVQILEHCREAGEHEKLIQALLEYANLCVELQNLPQALKTLKDAELFITENLQLGDNNEKNNWHVPILHGQIKALTGAAYLESGQIDEAYQNLNEALCYYGYQFPRGKFARGKKMFTLKMKQNFGLYFSPTFLVGSAQGYDAEFCNKFSECLSSICEVYMNLNLWKHAELATIWSLNKALSANNDFYKICVAFANVIEVCYRVGKVKIIKVLEVHALRLCHRKKGITMEVRELKAVCKLYASIFCARIMRSDIDEALHMGYIINRLGANVHATFVILKILPIMVFCLLATQRLIDVTTLLNDLQYYATEDTDSTGMVWYFTLGLIFNLETGYTYVTYEQCKTFYDIGGETLLTVRDPEAEKCFYIVVWLWCLRNDRWNSASTWYIKIHKTVTIEKDDSIISMISSLYLLEGLLIYIAGKMDCRNIIATAKAYKEIKKLIACIKCITKNFHLVLPRFYHLKAYFSLIRNKEDESVKLLKIAKKLAKDYKNHLERRWIEHSELAWSHNMSTLMLTFWKDHNVTGNIINYHEASSNEEMPAGLFTLPISYYQRNFL